MTNSIWVFYLLLTDPCCSLTMVSFPTEALCLAANDALVPEIMRDVGKSGNNSSWFGSCVEVKVK